MAVYNPLYTQYLMDKCGVAWFKFDEDSGNVKDSKGSSVGTITGVSRVNGWNGEGKALSFNGTSDYVSFDTKPFPNGRKSIKFKIMTSTIPTAYIYFMSCSLNFTTSTGEWMSIDSNGKLNYGYFPGGNSSTSSNKIDSTISIADGRWHDILLTWDGTTSSNGIKLYIDDMKTPNAQATASTASITNSNNMYLGVSANFVGQSNRYFNGQIDEIEIYNDVINPIAEKFLLSANKRIYTITQVPDVNNLVPAMTSNTTPSGVASTSSVYGSGVYAYLAFNQSDSKWLSGNVGGKAILSYKFSEPKIVSAYSLKYYASYNGHNLRDWTFEGSNDGNTWDILDSQSGIDDWTSNVKKTFLFKNKKQYLYYRLNITATSSNTYVALGEMEMFEAKNSLVNMSNCTESDFINHGVDEISFESLLGEKKIERTETTLGSGRVFEHTIDLSKRRVDKINL